MAEKLSRENRYRGKDKKEPSVPKASFNWSRMFSGPRAPLAWGLFFMLIAIIMEVAFFSYVFTGNSDQSALDTASSEGVREAGRRSENIFGYLGALTAHIFIFRWFGLGALALPIIPFLAGWK